MDSHLQHITLAALLHDIGKVMQRAEVPVSAETQNLMVSAGPTWDGRSSHYHVMWTSQFFEDHLGDSRLPELESFDERASYLAFRHHNPASPLQRIITEADHLSSGMDRGESHYERDIQKRKRLVPLQTLLSTDSKPAALFARSQLRSLTSTDTSCFPSTALPEENLVPEYQQIWAGFLKDWDDFRPNGAEATLARLDALFERYFWCVPASAIDEIPDTSLYGHSRIVAALAGALYLYHRDEGGLEMAAIKDRAIPKFLLVAGDLSGIQSFIFSIAHTGGGKVAKRLRARSFSLGCLTQIFALKVVRDLDLPFLNVILSAGGKFHLLLPNTVHARSCLDSHEREIQAWLKESFQGLLSLNLARVEMTGEDFVAKGVGQRFNDLSNALARKKHQPLGAVLRGETGWHEEGFLLPSAVMPNESATGYYDVEGPLDEETLGAELSRGKCLALYDSAKGKHSVMDWSFSVAEDAGTLPSGATYLISFKRGVEARYGDRRTPIRYEYHATHVPRYDRDRHSKLPGHSDWSMLIDAGEPFREGQILPFNVIAKTSRGRDSIAYLKADVDNLGFLFRCGLDWTDTRWTLSKIATFSRSLEFFFSGRIENILNEPEFEFIYTVFSGGDDVLLVGPWDAVHNFARRLREEWREFTADNPHLTLSVGISLARPMTPVWAASESAEDALLRAKDEPSVKGGCPKDQLCSFGHLVKWGDVAKVFETVNRLSHWMEGGLSASFVRSLIHYGELARLFTEEGKVEGLRYLPLLSYSLSRNVKDDEIRRWAEDLKDHNGEAIRHIGFAATYAHYLNRG